MDVLRRLGWWWALPVLVLAGLASTRVDTCGTWAGAEPQALTVGRARGALRAGAAVVPLEPRYPVTVAGYPPPRPAARSAAAPLAARATAVEVGGQRVTLVALDVLLVTARLQLQVQAGLPGRVWLLATHTHSGPGGHDPRPAAELAALGLHHEEDERALVAAARAAVEQAQSHLEPARLEVASAELAGLTVPRSGTHLDRRLTRLRFVGARPLAQWLILAAHPTLVPPGQAELDPDWPGRLAAQAEANRGPVTLVLQGAGGNASVDRAAAATPEDFARRVLAVTPRVATDATASPDPALALSWAEVAFALPRPDGSRLAPAWLRTPVENLLCAGAEHDALVAVLRLGPASLLLTTVEPSAEAGAVLEARARAGRVLGLANGYHGYLEPEGAVREATGEARKQYFGPGFMRLLGDAAQLAGDLAGP
jgi:hypothetical protein